MRRIALIALLALAVGAQAETPGAQAATPGRTDGPEGSEYGKGGYHYKAQYGRFYTEGFLGAAMMESEAEDTETNLITGLNAGYMVEEWLAFQVGFARILEQNINLYAGGVRSAYVSRPFNYYFSLDAELYSPEIGDTRFGIVPGRWGRGDSQRPCAGGLALPARLYLCRRYDPHQPSYGEDTGGFLESFRVGEQKGWFPL